MYVCQLLEKSAMSGDGGSFAMLYFTPSTQLSVLHLGQVLPLTDILPIESLGCHIHVTYLFCYYQRCNEMKDLYLSKFPRYLYST